MWGQATGTTWAVEGFGNLRFAASFSALVNTSVQPAFCGVSFAFPPRREVEIPSIAYLLEFRIRQLTALGIND